MFWPGLDLNFESVFCHPAMNFVAGVIDASRQVGVRTVDGTSAANNLSSLCGALWWTSQGKVFQLFGSVPVDGLCAIDVSRKPARYRSLSSRSRLQALSLGHSLDRSAQYLGQCQRDAGLAHLLRLCPEPDCHGPTAVRRRTLWSRTERDRLCSRCNHHRSVPVGISLGAVPFD